VENKNIIEILRTWLGENGYDGLYAPDLDNCGCRLDDLCPCGEASFLDCSAAYRHADGCMYFEKEHPDA
jgi:hypothetical protein